MTTVPLTFAGPDAGYRPVTPPTAWFTGWDHIELWVGNARQAAHFLASALGFTVAGYAGPETGVRDRASYLLEQGAVRFVVSAGLGPDSDIARHVRRHGDGVHDLAIGVTDAAAAYDAALGRGAVGLRPPEVLSDDSGSLVVAAVATYGETRHSFVERRRYGGGFAPAYVTTGLPATPPGPAVGLEAIDHCVGNVELGALGPWVNFYRETLGFDQLVHFDDEQISTEYSALMSTVVWDGSKVVLPINEPAEGRRRSQIQEYLDFYGGPGVQHIALRTDDIVASVSALRARGVRFLAVPATYYEDARRRLADLDLPWDELQDLGILVDRDQDGHLLQVFTETLGDRPTLFFEIIQREGAKGFGAGNFKALFEAIEREQARRGNL
ncbi:MAG TPA: 4-hydroxyphenylpyruvate dioxygenase [Acidimicrobiales bacterium]|nr:4-hydroxyphenylpyruvate dioxygenase [Acidimicrobiales bacterium]